MSQLKISKNELNRIVEGVLNKTLHEDEKNRKLMSSVFRTISTNGAFSTYIYKTLNSLNKPELDLTDDYKSVVFESLVDDLNTISSGNSTDESYQNIKNLLGMMSTVKTFSYKVYKILNAVESLNLT